MKRGCILCSFFVLSACAAFSSKDIVLMGPGGNMISVNVEIADTPLLRERGLMDRTHLPDNTGMLFDFDNEQHLSFWMKNTLIPLDILFFDDEGVFVSGASMVPCKADPCPIYASAEQARMALEVPAGFIETYSVGDGWSLRDAK